MGFKDPGVLRELAGATNYRDFLAIAFAKARAGKSRLTYAEFARRAGFTARSFPRDVLLGKKRLTYESAARFAEALGLTTELSAYFLSLVAREEKTARLPSIKERELDVRLRKLRKRVFSRATELKGNPAENIYRRRYWLDVYAALGTVENGATLADVTRRTKLPPGRCQSVLTEMVKKNIVRFDENRGRFFAGQSNVNFQNLGDDPHFRQWYLDCLAQARKRAAQEFRSDQALFMNSVFSLSRSEMARLKQELRDLIARFIDTAEDGEGDAIAKLSIALYAE